MRTSRGVIGFLSLLAVACVEDTRLSCIDDYILDGERCVFRGGATGEPEDAGTLDAGQPVDAATCDASADAAWPGSDAGCTQPDAGEQDEEAVR
jgi:hypothetical protein